MFWTRNNKNKPKYEGKYTVMAMMAEPEANIAKMVDCWKNSKSKTRILLFGKVKKTLQCK